MKISQTKLKMVMFFTVLVAGFALMGGGSVHAATRTWTGAGSDENFTTAANWGGTAPVNGDSIVFTKAGVSGIDDCSTPVVNLINDLSGSVILSGITFGADGDTFTSCPSGSAGQVGMKITGSTLKLAGDVVSFWDSRGLIVSDITFSTNATVEAYIDGLVAIGSHNLSISKGGLKSLSGTGSLTIGVTSGTCGYPQLYSLMANDFSGAVIVNCGYLYSSASSNIVETASSVTFNANSSLSVQYVFGVDKTIDTPITFSGTYTGTSSLSQNYEVDSNDPPVSSTSLTLSGAVTLTGTLRLTLNHMNLKFTGDLTGSNKVSVNKGGVGSAILPDGTEIVSELNVTTIDADNADSYCYESDYGLSINQNNKYIWSVSCPELGAKTGETQYGDYYDGRVRGILAGTGVLGSIRVMNGGIIAPGNSPGTLTVTNLTFETGGTYEFEMAGNEPGQFDLIKANGAVNLGDGTLRVTLLDGFTPEKGKTFTIVENDGSDAVVGTFAGLTQGSTVEIDGVGYFTISYTGGDGNDVTLTSIPGVGNTGNRQSSHVLPLVVAGMGTIVGVTQFRRLALARRRK